MASFVKVIEHFFFPDIRVLEYLSFLKTIQNKNMPLGILRNFSAYQLGQPALSWRTDSTVSASLAAHHRKDSAQDSCGCGHVCPRYPKGSLSVARPSKMAPCGEWGELLTGHRSSGRGCYEQGCPAFLWHQMNQLAKHAAFQDSLYPSSWVQLGSPALIHFTYPAGTHDEAAPKLLLNVNRSLENFRRVELESQDLSIATVMLEKTRESLGLQRDPTSPSQRKSTLNVRWKDWGWSWSSNTLATWCEELTHWKRLWCWER